MRWLCRQSKYFRMAVGFGGCVAIVVAVGTFLSWIHWGWLHGDGTSPAATMRNVFLVLAAPIALLLASWRSFVAGFQANTAEHGLLNERYQRGSEMLGHPTLAVRLGGIYALRNLSKDAPDPYHMLTMELFCTFVRQPTFDKNAIPTPSSNPAKPFLRNDVQAALTAIANRKKTSLKFEPMEPWIDLHGSYLRGANLDKAWLGTTDLSGAFPVDAKLADAHLLESDLSDADLSGANLSVSPGKTDKNKFDLHYDQLAKAYWDPDNIPILTNRIDPNTGEPLVCPPR